MSDKKPNVKISSDNALMDLRLVILRTISKVWDNDEHHKSKGKDLRERLTSEDFTNKELNKFFVKTFGYHNPFENFTIKFIPATAKWNVYGDNEWTKPEHETITICLPNNEKEWSEYQKTEKLMEYYNYFPSFFGSARKIPPQLSSNTTQSEVKLTSGSVNSAASAGTDFSGNDYNLGVSEDSFLSFGAVINKIIAFAWQSDEFKEIIDYNSDVNQGLPHLAYFNKIQEVLQEHYSFDFPWAFNLKFVFADNLSNKTPSPRRNDQGVSLESFWIKDNNPPKNDGDAWLWRTGDIIRNLVTLEVPFTPDSKETNVSLALAKYNAIGPAYPFTCS